MFRRRKAPKGQKSSTLLSTSLSPSSSLSPLSSSLSPSLLSLVASETSFHASRIELDKTESLNVFFEHLFFHFSAANESPRVFIKNSTYRQLATLIAK